MHCLIPNRKESGEGSGVSRVSGGFLGLTSCWTVSNATHYAVSFVVLLGGRNKKQTYWHLKQNQKSLFPWDLKLDLSHGIAELLILESAGLDGFYSTIHTFFLSPKRHYGKAILRSNHFNFQSQNYIKGFPVCLKAVCWTWWKCGNGGSIKVPIFSRKTYSWLQDQEIH